jgi:hypothetical protein
VDGPNSAKGATVMQCLVGLGYLAWGTFFVVWIYSPVTGVREAFAAAARPSLPFVVGVIAIGLLAAFGAIGMWRGRLWGWLLALLVDLGTAIGTAYYIIEDYSYFTTADIALGVSIAAVPLGWLVLPNVRDFYWKS